MKIINHWLEPNIYIRDTVNTIFLVRLFQSINDVIPDSVLNTKSVVTGLIKYPNSWPRELDLFKYFKQETIHQLQNKNCFFVFDATAEGFSPLYENWFDILYNGCEKYNIDPNQIIFTSSNLKDEKTLEEYCKTKNKKPINLISFPMFENSVTLNEDAELEFNLAVSNTKTSFNNKYFSSLSRLKRQHRIVSQFLLCQNKIKDQALISQDKLSDRELYLSPLFFKCPEYNIKHIKRWNKSLLPLTIDQINFNINWATIGTFSHIHHQTIFQLVNETLVDNLNNTSLFYSEKTFRPISCFQPFIIFGQPGCNHYLEKIGYKLYNDWFDLSFDYEENYIERFLKILKVLEKTCQELNSMNREQQILWKFKNKKTLIHNYNVMRTQEYSKEKLKKFVMNLEKQITI